MTHHLTAVVDWYLAQLAAHGYLAIAVQSALIVAAWCAIGTALWHHDQRRRVPAAPDNTPGTDTRLLTACHAIYHPPTRKEDTP